MGNRFGLIGAMDEEIRLILAKMDHKETVIKAGIHFYTGVFAGKSVVLCKSGVGKVNAAMTTQILIDSFEASQMLFTGVAGALHPQLNIGDIVISSECTQHDMDVTALGFPRGVIPYQEVSTFSADSGLVSLAERACLDLEVNFVKGKVLSGDQFIADTQLVTQLRSELNGACAEMEGAAVAQVCYMNNIPYVIIRSMSDKADGSAHINFEEFTVEASQRSYAIVERILQFV